MVIANGYKRAKGVGLGLTIPYGLLAAASWVYMGVSTGFSLRRDWSEYYYLGENIIFPEDTFVDLILGCLGVLWGIVLFSLAIHGVRKSKATLDPAYRVVSKIMIGASVLWITRSGLITVNNVNTFDLVAGLGHTYSMMPLLNAVFVDLLGLALFGSLFMCYRPHLLTLHSGSAGYSRWGSKDDQMELREGDKIDPGTEVRRGSYA